MKAKKIVLTGGPGGGKTTASDLFRREIGDKIVIVPEAATMLFKGGFPRTMQDESRQYEQLAIYHVQQYLEKSFQFQFPKRVLICDRGTVDGAAYWPDGIDSYFKFIGSNLEKEFEEYEAVIFFESSAMGKIQFDNENSVRSESLDEAIRLDRKLFSIWSKHKNFICVPHENSFMKKINIGLNVLNQTLVNLNL